MAKNVYFRIVRLLLEGRSIEFLLLGLYKNFIGKMLELDLIRFVKVGGGIK